MAPGVLARRVAAAVGVAMGFAAAVAAGVAGHSSMTLPSPFSYDVFCKTESAQNWYVWHVLVKGAPGLGGR